MNNSRRSGAPARVIALEEAFMHPTLREFYSPAHLAELDLLKGRLADVGAERVQRMDASGIDLQVLSHVWPGVQELDADNAVRLSKEVNDWLAAAIARYPTRFAGFAMLPTQRPSVAADELERAVTQLGFKGALINGHTQGRYLDDDAFSVLLERAEALDVPIYIHPTDPPQAVTDVYYRGYPALVTGWAWQVETGTHLLRLMCGGVFDRFPGLKIIVGHMGELIPYTLERLNTALTLGNWLLAAKSKKTPPAGRQPMQKSVLYYLRENVFITTSGVLNQAVLDCAVAQLGIDNILFSVDDPMRDNLEAVEFLNAARLSQEDREKLAHGNAERLLRLSSGTRAHPPIAPILNRRIQGERPLEAWTQGAVVPGQVRGQRALAIEDLQAAIVENGLAGSEIPREH
jgi:predicted TIM-barrel fold metal-dependent hydrolase